MQLDLLLMLWLYIWNNQFAKAPLCVWVCVWGGGVGWDEANSES